MPRKSDGPSIEWCRAVLASLGCPNVRRAEGTKEWASSRGVYPLTPDLVAGPLVGGGHASDFYIDVFEPTGDQYVKPQAGNPKAAATLMRAIVERSKFGLGDIDDKHEWLFGPMNKKLVKYVGSRGNTPMFGLGMYFRVTGNQYVGPIIASLAALNGLDRAFGITHHRGPAAMDKIMRGVMSPGNPAFIVTLPIEQPLAFVLYVAEKVDAPRVVLLVNEAVINPVHPYANHVVIAWLLQLARPSA